MKIGFKINKSNLKNSEYADCAVWCNKNNAHIEDKDTYYEIVENPKVVVSEKDILRNEVLKLEKQTGYTRIIREIISQSNVSTESKNIADRIEKIAIKLRN